MSAAVTPRSRTGPRSERLALAAGAAVAATLALVGATLDLGDAGLTVRARAADAAAGRAELARLAWQERLRRAGPPAPTLGLRVLVPRAPSFDATGAPRPPRPDEAALATLLDAARAAASEGNVARALLVLEEALASAPAGASRRPEALLAGLAWAARLGADEVVDRFRRELARLDAAETVGGTSAQVLAALTGPPDAAALERARAALAGPRVPLPAPVDAVRLEAGAGLVFQPDPRWLALRTALAARAPELDWDAAFRVPERAALAVGAWWPGDGDPTPAAARAAGSVEPPAAWRVTRRGDALVLERREATGRTVGVTTPARLAASLTVPAETSVEPSGAARTVYAAGAAAREALLDDPTRVLGLSSLEGTGVAFTVLDPGFPARIAAEERRVLAVRAGLLLLAALVLGASLLSWRALRRGRRLSELRSTFVASVSHDLRTPLASMLLLIDNLEAGRVAGEGARARYVVALRQEGERLKRMVEDLLDASRIERGAGPRLARESLDAATFLDGLERDLLARAALAGARASVTRGACPRTLHLDPDAVRRAVWNLFDNALHHGRRSPAPAEVRVALGAEDGVLSVEVEDDGPGVPWRHRESVFEPFERLADHGARGGLMDDTGTGLGLSIVRAIARAHGGDVALLEPRPEVGARFRMTLRVDGAEEAA